MPYILVDTSIFIRLNGKYEPVLECILAACDVIACTRGILNEYEGRAHSSPLFHLLPFLRELEERGKLELVRSSYVSSRVSRYENRRTINYPSHNRDKKWVKAAIAVEAEFIVTANRHLLGVLPNRFNGDSTEILLPSQYLEKRCRAD